MPVQNKIGSRIAEFADVAGIPFLAWAIALIVFLRYRVQVLAFAYAFIYVCVRACAIESR